MKFAMVGVGSIAIKMSNTIKNLKGIEMYAVTSLNYEKAKAFAKTYHYQKVYSNIDDMVQDEKIDLVYIATPHTHHFQCARKVLEAGKHVLCEKPFTVNAQQARELCSLAKEKNLLITEAIWTRYMPSRTIINDIISSGAIGEIQSINANIGYELSKVPRIQNPRLGGGALLDVGVYLLNFSRMILGTDIIDITSTVIFENGVDIEENITIKYPDNKMANLHCGVRSVFNRMGCIFGTKGYIEVQNINNPEEIRVYNDEYKLVKTYNVPEQISGYEYEVQACIRAIEEGKLECPEMPHKETIAIMEIMDDIRQSWNYHITDIR